MADLGAPEWVHEDGKKHGHKARPREDEANPECAVCDREIKAVPVELSPSEAYAYIENWVSEHTELCSTAEHNAHIDQAFTVLAGLLA